MANQRSSPGKGTKRDTTKKKYICTRCGSEYDKQNGNFARCASPLVAGNDKYLTVCNQCLDDMYHHYFDVLGNRNDAIRRMCMKFDLYFSDKVLTMIDASKREYESPMKAYLSKVNLAQVPGTTFDDTLDEEREVHIDTVEDIDDLSKKRSTEYVPTVDDYDMWGPGYTAQEYKMLNAHYHSLVDVSDDLSRQDAIIRTLCETYIMKERARQREEIGKYKDLSKIYTDYYAVAGFKKRKSTDEMANENLGVMAAIAEGIGPAEYYQDKTLFRDYDGIGEYMDRFVRRPLQNLMTGETEMDPEYNVGDDYE